MQYINIIYIIILIFIVSFILLRLLNRFWSTQPVFHFYNIWFWLFPIGIIQTNIPKKNKFYDKNIVCNTFNKISTEKKALLVPFIQRHYISNNKNIKYFFDKEYILEHLKHQRTFSHISLQYDLIKYKLIGCLTSRLLCGHINKKKFFISYLDFLCIHEKYIKGDFGYKQILSHYIKSRENGAQPIFLFKRSKKLKLLVPLTTYKTFSFDANKLNKINRFLPVNICCHTIKSYNFQLFKDFIEKIQKNFKCFIIPNFINIKNLINKNILFPFIIKDGLKVVAVIIYKKTCIKFKNKSVVNCVASYCSDGYERIFKESITNTVVLLKKNILCDIINFENKSHNYLLINFLRKRFIPKGTLMFCYYFYNFIIRPQLSRQIFIID